VAKIKSSIALEAKAVVKRLRLEDRLNGRPDIIGTHRPSAALRKVINANLVPGVDYPGVAGPGELPAGGRYVKLCFSDAIESLANSGIAPYLLPATTIDLQTYYEMTLGLNDGGWLELQALFGFDFALVDSARSQLLATDHQAAWRLLLSHEFDLAVSQCASLKKLSTLRTWRKPIVDAFKVLAELERLVLLAKRLARIDTAVDISLLLSMLDERKALRFPAGEQRDEIFAFLERLLIADIAIETYITNPDDLKKALPADFPLKQIEHGRCAGYNSTMFDNTFVQDYLVDAIRTCIPKGPGRLSTLDEVPAGSYWLISNEHLIGVGLIDIKSFLGRTVSTSSGAAEPFLTRRTDLLTRLLAFADPARHKVIIDRITDRGPTLENNYKRSKELATSYLPKKADKGAAARFNPFLWTKRDADVAFWRLLQDSAVISALALPKSIDPLKAALDKLQCRFTKIYSLSRDAGEEPTLAVAIMATSSSALTGNRATARALRTLLSDKSLRAILKRI
jgi:hypothetical protein